jgi:hypothetical protein
MQSKIKCTHNRIVDSDGNRFASLEVRLVSKRESDKITRAEMRDALLRSGYLLESRVEAVLRQRWGYVEANATYPDPETGKSREFDVFAMSARGADAIGLDHLFGVLMVECVNNPQPLVILTKQPQVGFLHYEEIKMSGLPTVVINQKFPLKWRRLADYLDMCSYHHYCVGRVGTQFCSFTKKRSGKIDQWLASHEGTHFDSFRKLCDATDHYINKHYKHWQLGPPETVNLQIFYPIVVVQGDLIEATQTARSVMLRSADHIQFRITIADSETDLSYQIDVVREKFLPRYLELIDNELAITARKLRRKSSHLRASIEKLVSNAKDVGASDLRKIFEGG